MRFLFGNWSIFRSAPVSFKSHAAKRTPARLMLEQLEDRICPTGHGSGLLPISLPNVTISISADNPTFLTFASLTAGAMDPNSGGTIEPSTLTIVSQPPGAEATTDGSGDVTYTPGSLFSPPLQPSGYGNFEFQVGDNLGAISNVATAIVGGVVSPTFPGFQTTPAATSTNFSQSVSINVAPDAVDGAPADPTSVSLVSVAPSSSTEFYDVYPQFQPGEVIGPSHGTAIVNGNGVITYTPSVGYTGSDAIGYEISDTSGDLAYGVVYVSVTATLTAGAVSATGGVAGTTPTSLAADFTDFNTIAPSSDFSGTINWGDGNSTAFTSSDVSGSDGSYTISGSHLYAADGDYLITVAVNGDNSSATENGTLSLGADNSSLDATSIQFSGNPSMPLYTTIGAFFTDSFAEAPTSDFSGAINWGDGATTLFISGAVLPSSGVGAFEVYDIGHQYAAAGTYAVTATIDDVDGDSSSITGTIFFSGEIANPTIISTASPSSLTLGATPPILSDTVVLANGLDPTGDLAFTLEGPQFDYSQTVPLTTSGNGTYTASYTLPIVGTLPGIYSWSVNYSGDQNNNEAFDQSGTADETLVSAANNPTITSMASPPVSLGTTAPTLSDTAVLANAFEPTGTLIFVLTGPNNFDFTQTDPLKGNGTYTASDTLPVTGTAAGTYTWSVVYQGDYNNNYTVDQSGTADQTVVSSASPTMTSTVNPPITLGATAPTLSDSVVLASGYYPTGSLVFTLTGPNGFTYTQTDALTGSGNGTYTASDTLPNSGTVAGNYFWFVLYNGDVNNEAVGSGEQTVVSPASPTITSTASPGITLGTTDPTLSDSAILANGYNPTGSLVFTLNGPNGFFYTQTDPLIAGGNGTYTASYLLPATGAVAGTYTWSVSYVGDPNNSNAVDQGGTADQTVVSPASGGGSGGCHQVKRDCHSHRDQGCERKVFSDHEHGSCFGDTERIGERSASCRH